MEVLDRHALDTGPRPPALGDRSVGVVWHTQGSGKSLTMAFYAGRIVREPAMKNPTLVVLTDCNDLHAQLFATFLRCQDLLRKPPEQAQDRADLRRKLDREAGGGVFTKIQKVLPRAEGRPPSAAVGAPQPVRLHRRLRGAHAGRQLIGGATPGLIVVVAHTMQEAFPAVPPPPPGRPESPVASSARY